MPRRHTHATGHNQISALYTEEDLRTQSGINTAAAKAALETAHQASGETEKQQGWARRRARAAVSADSGAAEERYINREQLRELIPASDMTLWRWQRNPEIAFPHPVKLGANGRNFWWLPKIRAWMRHREEGPAQTAAGAPGVGPAGVNRCQKPAGPATDRPAAS